MDVVKVLSVLTAAFLFLNSCSQKKTVESVSITAKECLGEASENRFVVEWEDGTFSVEHGKNLEEFRTTFIKNNLQDIKHVDPDHVIHLNSAENTIAQKVYQQSSLPAPINWGPGIIQAAELWNQNILGDGIIVGIIDGMVDVNHAQLRPNILINNREIPNNNIDDDNNGIVDDYLGAQFNKELNDPNTNRHGSHVAGIVGADFSKGPVQGVAPKVKILPAQFIGNDGAGNIGDAILAMNYAASRGAKILNLSWGGAPCLPSLASAMELLSAQGILLITAAGNGDSRGNGINVDEQPDYPSGFGLLNQINVAASTVDDFMINFSNFGIRKVQVAAPGVDIDSTTPGNRIERMSGTSMSAPLTAGAAALLWSAYPNATSQQIKVSLLRGVDVQAGHEFQVSTRGRINVKKSLAELKKLLGL